MTDEERMHPEAGAGSDAGDGAGGNMPDWDEIARTVARAASERARQPEEEGAEPAATQGPVSSASGSLGVDGGIAETIHYSIKQSRRVRDVLTRILSVRRAARLYPFEHPAVADGVRELFAELRTYHDEGVEVQFAFYEGELVFGDTLLTEESVLFEHMIADMADLGVGSLVFRRELDEPELVRAMMVLSADKVEVTHNGGIEAMFSAADTPHVAVSALVALDHHSTPSEPGEPTEEARAAFSSAVSLLREIDRLLRGRRTVAPAKVKGVVRSLVDNVLTNRHAMLQLSGLKNYDEYTFYHSANVAILSLALGSTITTDHRFLQVLGTGALLHDIGKLAIDIEILNKPGPLAPDEWEAMREHPARGAEITGLMPGVDKAALVAILEHHMRFDGAGYPTRTPFHKQHITSRIVAVADSYDAMTSQRSYSAPRVQDEAMATLARGAGSSFDPTLVRLFIGLMGLYPPRSVVRLSDGSVAIVLAPADGRPTRPVVRVIADPDGEFTEPRDLALAETPELSVDVCIDPRMVNIEVDDYV